MLGLFPRDITFFPQCPAYYYHLFHTVFYSTRLLNYNFQYEHYSIVITVNDTLSGMKHEEISMQMT
jgi:hypothetical protein